MNVTARIHPTNNSAHESAEIHLHVDGRPEPFLLDVDGSTLLHRGGPIDGPAIDLFSIACAVYATDKAVARNAQGEAEDRWTRQIRLTVPVQAPDPWQAVAAEFSQCVSFLTGDLWSIHFEQADRAFLQPRLRRHPIVPEPLFGEAVSLFSGGLDSYVGAIDWLDQHPAGRLCLASHYDGHISGPHADQERTLNRLRAIYQGRISHLQVRAGIRPAGPEKSLRSRSLLFVALGLYAANALVARCPLIVPENGPIAVNFPLIPTRRGSCSTRTTHPYFMGLLRAVLPRVGLNNPINNPYEFETKGEMVANCRNPGLLARGIAETVSCAKAGHKRHWDDRMARACGRCVPCLFRRAAIHRGGLPAERYGIDVLSPQRAAEPPNDDSLALFSFVRQNLTVTEVARTLVCNGSLPYTSLRMYADVVIRMRDEVRAWLASEAPRPVRALAGLP